MSDACVAFIHLSFEKIYLTLLARTRLITNQRFPACSLGFVFLKTQHFSGFRSSQRAGSHLTRLESALWWRCLLYFCCLCSCISLTSFCLVPAGCVGLGLFSRSRVGPHLDVRPTSSLKVTLIIAAAVCTALPFISTRRRQTLQGD